MLIAATLAVAPPSARAACPAPPPPAIVVTDDVPQPRFDFSLDRAALNRKFHGVTLPSPQIYHLSLNAVMSGDLRADHYGDLAVTGDDRAVCLRLKTLNVTLRMRPVIYMDSSLRGKPCPFQSILEHELKHVAVDRGILQAYEPRLHDGLAFTFDAASTSLGPFPPRRLAEARKAMEARIEGALTNLMSLLWQERVREQRQVDTMGEYARLSNACPNGSP